MTMLQRIIQSLWITAILLFVGQSLSAQKFLLLERAKSAKTVKYAIGDRITFRLTGEEDYWYKRTITDILPDSKSIMMDNYWVKVEDIAAIKRPPRIGSRIAGGALLSFGIGLGFASTAALLYRDRTQKYPILYGGAGLSMLTSKFMIKPRKLYMGEKNRLRAIEIKFGVSE